jgi:hypothetical protein
MTVLLLASPIVFPSQLYRAMDMSYFVIGRNPDSFLFGEDWE